MAFRILIIDDELEMCISLSKILVTYGYEALYTTESQQVQEILKSKVIDLIIMDIRIPGIDGIQLLKKVKSENWSIPIIMISGYGSVDNIVRS
ncbi:MAG: response regulator, partial [Spirochaetota bacterium]